MSTPGDARPMSSCGCYEDTTAGGSCCGGNAVDSAPRNAAGQPSVRYRVGTHSIFLRNMLGGIHRWTERQNRQAGKGNDPNADSQARGAAVAIDHRPLATLATRNTDDPAIALLDAWAVTADVLTFYQERIANENYLRTATERRSVLELARTIGYELKPGVAADVFAAFTTEDAPGAPRVVPVPSGTQIMSVPPSGQLPQTFETIEAFEARPELNALRPRLSQPQAVKTDMKRICVAGTAPNIQPGDRLLIVPDGTAESPTPMVVATVEPHAERQCTIVCREDAASQPAAFAEKVVGGALSRDYWPKSDIKLTAENVTNYLLQQDWSDSDLKAFLTRYRWSEPDLLALMADPSLNWPSTGGSIHVFREKARFFGHNAPLFATLSTSPTTYPGLVWDGDGLDVLTYQQAKLTDQQAEQYYHYRTGMDVHLERVVRGILPHSWFNLVNGSNDRLFSVLSTKEVSLAGYALSADTTGIELAAPGTKSHFEPATDLSDYKVRLSTAYLRSEELVLAQEPIEDDIQANSGQLMLNGLELGLRVGQRVALTGERADAPGVMAVEMLEVTGIKHWGGYTVLVFGSGPRFSYRRETVFINANVARATHGETVREVLGSGDGAKVNQRFTLKKRPLTYLSAPTPAGIASTLTLRVNDVRWDEISSLYGLGPRDERYTVRIDNEARATIIFGDGKSGARLPSGAENVRVEYRKGIGSEGEVAADTLTILKSRPAGLRSVTNPLAASGAEGSERLELARRNAPRTVLAMERIVSLRDFEDFANAFPGFGKAQAVNLWYKGSWVVFITVAAASGKVLDDNDPLLDRLRQAIDAARDPSARVRVGSFQPRQFDTSAILLTDGRHLFDVVAREARSALLAAYSFEQRSFAQPVAAAEVITVLQRTPGVAMVDLEGLAFSPGGKLNTVLTAQPSGVTGTASALFSSAELLLINPDGITLRPAAGGAP